MAPTDPRPTPPPQAPKGQSLTEQLTEIDASAEALNAEPPTAASPPSPAPRKGPGRPKGAKTGSGKSRRPSAAGTPSGAAKVTEVAGNLGRAAGSATTAGALAKLEKRWTTFLTELLGYGSVLWVWYLTHDDEALANDDQLKDDLELDDAEAGSIAEPLGRILLRMQYVREHSEQVLQSSDYLAVAAGLGAYAASTGPQLRAKRRRQAERAAIRRNQAGVNRQQQQPRSAPNVPRDQNGAAPPEPSGPIEPAFGVRPFQPGAQYGGE